MKNDKNEHTHRVVYKALRGPARTMVEKRFIDWLRGEICSNKQWIAELERCDQESGSISSLLHMQERALEDLMAFKGKSGAADR